MGIQENLKRYDESMEKQDSIGPEKPIAVFVTVHHSKLVQARNMLQSAGIPFFTTGEDRGSLIGHETGGNMVFMRPMRLLVGLNNADKAYEILMPLQTPMGTTYGSQWPSKWSFIVVYGIIGAAIVIWLFLKLTGLSDLLKAFAMS